MARPTPNTIASGQQSWDADINDTTNTIFNQPFPPHEVADEAALAAFAPAAYDRCIVATVTPSALWLSDGTAWKRIPLNQDAVIADQAALTAVAGTGDDATINSNFTALRSKINDILAKLRAAGVLDT